MSVYRTIGPLVLECLILFNLRVFRGYTMDVICSTGFGLDVNSQRDPNNPFVKHAKSFFDAGVTENPLIILCCKSLNSQ